MKIALDWIAEYLSPAPLAEAAAEALMNAGLPVESIAAAEGVRGPTQVLDVEVTSNRTDCLSHVGLARELSAVSGGTFKPPAIPGAAASPAAAAEKATHVEIQDLAACPYYSARVIRNVKVGPSPEWLRKRLESIGLRPVNNIVDITNFVLMELGQPLHAFDFDRLAGRRIIVRRAATGETLQAIDGRSYALDPTMLVIADAEKPAAIAGIMGGKESEVTEKTTTILLESARFEPLTIRTASRALGLKSDSSYRFERGIDPSMADVGGRRAAQLIEQIAGGETAGGAGSVVQAGEAVVRQLHVDMRLSRFRQIIGIEIAPDRALAILSELGFSPSLNENRTGSEDDVISTRVPPHRLDVTREIDLIEEVARVHGYQHVPALDRVSHAVKPESVREKAARAIREAMVAAGFSEAVTVAFIPEAEAKAFVSPGEGEGGGESLIRPQHGGWKADVLRPSLFPSLLAVRRTNQYVGIPDARVFEISEVFLHRREDGSSGGGTTAQGPQQRRILGALAGDLAALTGTLPLLAERMNPAARMTVEPRMYAGFVSGASGEVFLHVAGAGGKKSSIGRVGLIAPQLQRHYDLRHAVAALELDWELLAALFVPVREARAVPRFPGVKRDLSIVVEESVRWADVKAAIASARLEFLEQVEFVTTFRSAQVGAGKKSLTLALDFRDPTRTLKSEEVDAQVAAAVETLARNFSAALRA